MKNGDSGHKDKDDRYSRAAKNGAKLKKNCSAELLKGYIFIVHGP